MFSRLNKYLNKNIDYKVGLFEQYLYIEQNILLEDLTEQIN